MIILLATVQRGINIGSRHNKFLVIILLCQVMLKVMSIEVVLSSGIKMAAQEFNLLFDYIHWYFPCIIAFLSVQCTLQH